MPYKSERIIISHTDNDKRIKLTDKDKVDIKDKHDNGKSIHSLSYDYSVSRRTIQFILYPERHERNLDLRQQRGGSIIYYDKEKHREYIKKHRRYKQLLFTDGLIKMEE